MDEVDVSSDLELLEKKSVSNNEGKAVETTISFDGDVLNLKLKEEFKLDDFEDEKPNTPYYTGDLKVISYDPSTAKISITNKTVTKFTFNDKTHTTKALKVAPLT